MQNTITQPPRFRWRMLLIAALAGLLVACSAARIGFNNGAAVSYWWLDTYVDFDGAQKPWVKRHIADLFAWHRRTQLRNYAELASRIQRRDLSAVTASQLLADYEEGRMRVLAITDRAAPQLADLALSLTPAQIANIEDKLEKNNRKFRKDYLQSSQERRQEFRYRKMMKQAEYWFGNVNREQEAALRKLSDARPLNNELVLEDRLRRQQELIDLLRRIQAQRPAREETVRLIRAYIAAASDRFGNRVHQEFFDAGIRANAELVAGMMHLATPAQRSHFVKTVQDWIGDFNRLSAQAAS